MATLCPGIVVLGSPRLLGNGFRQDDQDFVETATPPLGVSVVAGGLLRTVTNSKDGQMNVRRYMWVGAIVAAAAVAGCSSVASSAPGTAAPASAAPAGAGAGGTIVEAKAVGKFPSILIASQGAKDNLGEDKSGFTLYYFTKDAKGSGTSACTDKCYANWPALVVPDGTTPTAGAGVTGTLGTIKRADDGKTQVTLNGQPLYYFSKDTAAGQSNGYYPGWGVVNADGSLVAPPSAAPASPAASASAPASAASKY